MITDESVPKCAAPGRKETKYDAPQSVSKSGICRESGCREEDEK